MKGDGIWYKNASDQKGFSPDYTNELLIAAHQRLITALGQRYDHDPAVAFIQWEVSATMANGIFLVRLEECLIQQRWKSTFSLTGYRFRIKYSCFAVQ
jgi:hypothetical protein